MSLRNASQTVKHWTKSAGRAFNLPHQFLISWPVCHHIFKSNLGLTLSKQFQLPTPTCAQFIKPNKKWKNSRKIYHTGVEVLEGTRFYWIFFFLDKFEEFSKIQQNIKMCDLLIPFKLYSAKTNTLIISGFIFLNNGKKSKLPWQKI